MATSGDKLVRDAALDKAAAAIGCSLGASAVELHQQLSLALRTKRKEALKRQEHIQTLRQRATPEKITTVHIAFERLATLENSIGSFFQQDSKEAAELQQDAIAQLSFQDYWFKSLNQVPYALVLIAAFKIWFVPAMAIIVPIVAWLMPYVLLRYMFNLPINQDEYFDVLRHLWSGGLPSPPYGFSDSGLPAVPSLWTPRSIFQGIVFIASFAQSLIQPIMNAMHLYKTDNQFVAIGEKILEVVSVARHVYGQLEMTDYALLADFDGLDSRRAFCLVQDDPERIRRIFLALGRTEVLWRLATRPEFHSCKLSDCEDASLILEGVRDISIEKPVPSSFHLGGEKRHAVITGPNGGGKSSALRAILQTVLFSHAYGMVPATFAEVPRFRWIASGLQLRDTPGKLSMFETEVLFAARTLSAGPGRGIVLFDELFHSTNPPDADRTAERFLRALWSKGNVISAVSTHNFGLIERAPESVFALCCPAVENGDDVQYTYRVEPGICKVSSVRKVWDRFGLSAAVPQ